MSTAVRKGWWTRNTLPWVVRIAPVGIASVEAFGAAVVTLLGPRIAPTGIPSGEAVGTPVVIGPATIEPAGIAPSEAFGTAVVTGGSVSVRPAGITPAEAFGTAAVVRGAVAVGPAGIPSDEAFGSASVVSVVAPVGIASVEAFGAAKIVCTVAPTGIGSMEAVGVPNIGRGPVTVTPAGIASLEAFGAAKVTFGPVTASGIASGEAFGTPAVSAGVLVTNTLAGSSFDTNFWGQNSGTGPGPGVYLSGGVVGSNTVGGFFGSATYRSWITCKTQLSANGSYVKSKLNAINGDDRGALLWVGLDSPTAATKGVWLALRPGSGTNDKLRIGWNADTTLAAADPPAAFATTDDWRFEWKKVGSDYVYKAYQNGVPAITFTDTNGATLGVPGRYAGIGSTVIQINFNNYQATNGFTGLVTCAEA